MSTICIILFFLHSSTTSLFRKLKRYWLFLLSNANASDRYHVKIVPQGNGQQYIQFPADTITNKYVKSNHTANTYHTKAYL